MGYDIILRSKLSASKMSIVARIMEEGLVENRIDCLRRVMCKVSADLTDSLIGSLARSGHFSEEEFVVLFGEGCFDSTVSSLFDEEDEGHNFPAGVDDIGRKLMVDFSSAIDIWLSGGEASELVKIAGDNFRYIDRTPAIDQPARDALDRFLFAGDTLLSDGSNSVQVVCLLKIQA